MSTHESYSNSYEKRGPQKDKKFHSNKKNNHDMTHISETKLNSRKKYHYIHKSSEEGRKYLNRDRHTDRQKVFHKYDQADKNYSNMMNRSSVSKSSRTRSKPLSDNFNRNRFNINMNSNNHKRKENLIKKKERVEALKKRTKYELMYEAFHIANLFYLMNESTLSEESTQIDSAMTNTDYYILSTNWFEKWKNYVNFDYYMQNTEKFLKLNAENSNSYSNSEKNLLDDLDKPIKIALENYFENYFLTDNNRLYPGAVSNKEFIYDKGLYYMDLNDQKSYLNYNVMEYFQMGRDYFIVNSHIWKYFKTIYGGKEIKRYIIDKSSDTSKEDNNTEEYLIETKLKNISLCIVRFKKDEMKLRERPKFVFFPRKKTIYDFKKYLLKIFSFLKDSLMRDLRLWLLDANYNFDSFEEYFVGNYNSRNTHGENIVFPGICLDLLDSNTGIDEIDALITNKIVVLEYVDNLNFKNFFFRRQYWSDLPLILRESFKADRMNEGEDRYHKKRSDYSSNSMNSVNTYNIYNNDASNTMKYDMIVVNKKTENNLNNLSSMFKIKKFFLIKYGMVKLESDRENNLTDNDYNNCQNKIYTDRDIVYDPKIVDVKDDKINSVINEEFVKETNFLRENLHLILDKNEIMQKFSYAYTNSDRFLITTHNKENSSKADVSDSKVKSRQEMIMRKRERAKVTSNQKDYVQKNLKIDEGLEENEELVTNQIDKDKEESVSETKHHENTYTHNIHNIDNYNSIKEEADHIIMEEKCNYCDKPIEEEIDSLTCDKCIKTKYCNATCKLKDFRFHSKTCL